MSGSKRNFCCLTPLSQSFRLKKRKKGRGAGKQPKLLVRPPAVHRSVGKRPFFVPSNQDLGLGLQERWSNLQFVVVTNRELWPVFTLGALSFLFRWGKGGGARRGEKKHPKLQCLSST